MVPFEKQDPRLGDRSCGAAALCMVYRSLGLDCTQRAIWPAVARPGADGQHRASTHLLGRDAMSRGFSALVMRARHPWRLLELCLSYGLRVILNHRPYPGAVIGHFSVLLDLTPAHIVVHDPALGPDRRHDRADFLKLWRKSWPWSEVAGNTLAAIGPKPPKALHTWANRSPCPHCQRPVLLPPDDFLTSFTEPAWEELFCLECDGSIN